MSACIVCAGLKTLSMAGLNELLEEIELTIKDYNDTLVQQLALRDDLDLDKVRAAPSAQERP